MSLPTVSWDENNPLGSQAISLGDDRIREMKTQLREVISVDHIFASSGSGATTGYHNQVTLVELSSKPTSYASNQIALYGKDVSSKTELFLVDEAGTEHQLTSNYLLNLATVTGSLSPTNGGTGLTSLTLGDILYASASNTISALAKNTTATRYLSNTGTSNIPAWAQVNLTNGVTGVLPIANIATGTPDGTKFVRDDGTLQSIVITHNTDYAFSAYKSTDQNVQASGGPTQITFDTEDFDTGNNFASSTFTAPVTGKYLFTLTIHLTNSSTVTLMQFYLDKNGSQYCGLCSHSGSPSSVETYRSGSIIMSLAATDTIKIYYVSDTASGSRMINSGITKTRFTGCYLT